MRTYRSAIAGLLASSLWVASVLGADYAPDTVALDPGKTQDVRIKKWPEKAPRDDGSTPWWIEIYNYTNNPVTVHLAVRQLNRRDIVPEVITVGANQSSGEKYLPHFDPNLGFESVKLVMTGAPGPKKPPPDPGSGVKPVDAGAAGSATRIVINRPAGLSDAEWRAHLNDKVEQIAAYGRIDRRETGTLQAQVWVSGVSSEGLKELAQFQKQNGWAVQSNGATQSPRGTNPPSAQDSLRPGSSNQWQKPKPPPAKPAPDSTVEEPAPATPSPPAEEESAAEETEAAPPGQPPGGSGKSNGPPAGFQPTLAHLADQLYAYDNATLRATRDSILQEDLLTSVIKPMQASGHPPEKWPEIAAPQLKDFENVQAQTQALVRQTLTNADAIISAIDAGQPVAPEYLAKPEIQALIMLKWSIISLKERLRLALLYVNGGETAPPATAAKQAAQGGKSAPAKSTPAKTASEQQPKEKQPEEPHDGYWFDPSDKEAKIVDHIIYVRINGEARRVPLSLAKTKHGVPASASRATMSHYSERLNHLITKDRFTHLSRKQAAPGKAARNEARVAYWYDPTDVSRKSKDKFIYVRIDGAPVRVPLDEAEGYGVPKGATIDTMTHYSEQQKRIVIDRGTHHDPDSAAAKSSGKGARPGG